MKAAWKLPPAMPSRGETRYSAILSASMPMRGVRYPPWLPPMLQSLRQLPASVRSRRPVAVRRGQGAGGDFKRVVDACTLCDMCFMTKCPYVPPHPFDVDFPHLMLAPPAAELRAQHGILSSGSSPRPIATASSPLPWRRSRTGQPGAATARPGLLSRQSRACIARRRCRSTTARLSPRGPAPNRSR